MVKPCDTFSTGLRIDEIHCFFVSVECIMSAFILISCLIRSNSVRTFDDSPHVKNPLVLGARCDSWFTVRYGIHPLGIYHNIFQSDRTLQRDRGIDPNIHLKF